MSLEKERYMLDRLSQRLQAASAFSEAYRRSREPAHYFLVSHEKRKFYNHLIRFSDEASPLSKDVLYGYIAWCEDDWAENEVHVQLSRYTQRLKSSLHDGIWEKEIE